MVPRLSRSYLEMSKRLAAVAVETEALVTQHETDAQADALGRRRKVLGAGVLLAVAALLAACAATIGGGGAANDSPVSHNGAWLSQPQPPQPQLPPPVSPRPASPAPPPPSMPPISPLPPAPPPWLPPPSEEVLACSQKARSGVERKVCGDFFSEFHGVAVTMLPLEAWKTGPDGRGSADFVGMDPVHFLDQPPSDISSGMRSQALSIIHASLGSRLFVGYCNVGLVFDLGSERGPADSGLWRCVWRARWPLQQAGDLVS